MHAIAIEETGPMSDDVIRRAAVRLADALGDATHTARVQERKARAAIKAEGGDNTDPLLLALVIERAQQGSSLIGPPEDGGSWLYRIKVGTGWPDRFVAELMGQSRATVQAYIGGRIPETVTRVQALALVEALKQQRSAIDGLINDLEGRL